jgi:hypothetical protein
MEANTMHPGEKRESAMIHHRRENMMHDNDDFTDCNDWEKSLEKFSS